ncbi:RadC family protein [Oceanibaculum pacificum]|uniref:MPN domain-containing protein n=1 Tax=Oceanibaculum pacificum TaxID=580166 RepID=A0A154WGL6_9PROT|nr:DNA repair protein RadC [Oceanibaculum pacificum]KZD12671.1 hypothetical protein AUP43_15580 [Oceanibaculum pacificum]
MSEQHNYQPGEADAEQPHYLGHRQRLRARFLADSGASMPDYELLELLLFLARPRGDMKPVAKALIDRFGNFAEVISADAQALRQVDGIGEAGLVALKSVQAGALRLLQQRILNRPVIASWRDLLDYCRASMGFEKIEQFRVLFLDRKNLLIADEVMQKGTIDQTPVYPREIIRRALELHASALIMVHNHPSGDPTPSRADIDLTKEVDAAAKALGLSLHDHLVIGREEHASFKAMGLL